MKKYTTEDLDNLLTIYTSVCITPKHLLRGEYTNSMYLQSFLSMQPNYSFHTELRGILKLITNSTGHYKEYNLWHNNQELNFFNISKPLVKYLIDNYFKLRMKLFEGHRKRNKTVRKIILC